ncbi:MAG: response regulator [Verrucomicrobiales bacterium]
MERKGATTSAAEKKSSPKTKPAPPQDPIPTVEEPSDPKVNILIVDDTPENLVALEAVLSDLGQNLVKARSGEEALRLILKQDFAVILLDVNMPGMNGFETAAMIRQRKNSEHTPIIFVSAISTSDTHLFKGYSLGAVDYIFTPVIADVLRSKVSVFVELLKKTEEAKRNAEKVRQIEEREHKRRLEEAAERLEFEAKRNRFFTLSIELIGIAGYDGYFKQLNPTWEQVLGFAENEMSRQPLLDFVHPEDRAEIASKLEGLLKKSAPAVFECRFCCKNGGYRWLAWTVVSYPAEELFYLFARDITENKSSEEEIRKLNAVLGQRARELESANAELQSEVAFRAKAEEALQESNSALEAFSYSVSHDLRAPLRAMQGFAKVLLEDYSADLDDMGRECADRIVSASERMDSLIQDLLVFSRLGHTTLDLKPISLDVLLEDVFP